MSILYKAALALVAGVFLYGAGWYSRGETIRTVEVPTVVTQTETKVVDHIQKVVVRETVTQPSGVKVEKSTETTTKVETKATEQVAAKQSVPAVPAPRADWSVGVTFTPRLDPDVYKPTGVEVGRRIVGPVWVAGGFNWRDHEAVVGVRAEF